MEKPAIIITGAASGIGQATALHFVRRDWFVGLLDIDHAALQAVAGLIGEENCCFRSTDITKMDEVQQAMEEFSNRTSGKLDVLFNCAGVLHMGEFEEILLPQHLEMLNVNLIGTLQCIYAALPLLKQTPGSTIISMSSASSLYGTPELATYSATKCAIRGLTEALNIELEKDDIHVCDISIPYVDTPLLKDKNQARSIDKLGVHLQPEAIAELVFKATRRRKIHWYKGLTPLRLVTHLFPFLRKAIVKHVTGF